MDTVSEVAGLILVAIVLRDIFDTLFHPHGRAIVGERVVRLIWAMTRLVARRRRSVLSVAGPIAYVMVILTWVTGVVVGGALAIEPSLPEGFVIASGQEGDSFGDALYVSFVSMTSLGYGDLVPIATTLKLFGPLQAAVGLAILSAAIAWIITVLGVLRSSRSVAREIDLLASSERVDPLELGPVTSQLITLDIELRQFPIAYHFPSLDSRREICIALGKLFALVESPPLDSTPQARRAEAAADGLLAGVNERFLGAKGTTEEEILALWLADHLWDRTD